MAAAVARLDDPLVELADAFGSLLGAAIARALPLTGPNLALDHLRRARHDRRDCRQPHLRLDMVLPTELTAREVAAVTTRRRPRQR